MTQMRRLTEGHRKLLLYAAAGKEGFYRRLGFCRCRARWRSSIEADPMLFAENRAVLFLACATMRVHASTSSRSRPRARLAGATHAATPPANDAAIRELTRNWLQENNGVGISDRHLRRRPAPLLQRRRDAPRRQQARDPATIYEIGTMSRRFLRPDPRARDHRRTRFAGRRCREVPRGAVPESRERRRDACASCTCPTGPPASRTTFRISRRCGPSRARVTAATHMSVLSRVHPRRIPASTASRQAAASSPAASPARRTSRTCC